MNFLKSIFGKKDAPIETYADFWNWFQMNQIHFHKVVRTGKNIEKNFFDKLEPKLAAIKDGIFYLTGMYDDTTAELIFTAEGVVENIVFIEELVTAAPQINGWRFTALKPALRKEDVSIEMNDLKFNPGNLFFYSNESPYYPDEIEICVIHSDMTDDNRSVIIDGIYIFLDNYLGELNMVSNIDNVKIIYKSEAEKELIPIGKLKDFLIWRQKEFVEKYDGLRYDGVEKESSILETELKNGDFLIAVINTDLLNWAGKASHPWIAVMTIKYDGSRNNGMPNKSDYESLNIPEDEMMVSLTGIDGNLHIGRQTGENKRKVYFACKDFRQPSKVLSAIQQKYGDKFEMDFDIYKDKYWRSFESFMQN